MRTAYTYERPQHVEAAAIDAVIPLSGTNTANAGLTTSGNPVIRRCPLHWLTLRSAAYLYGIA